MQKAAWSPKKQTKLIAKLDRDFHRTG